MAAVAFALIGVAIIGFGASLLPRRWRRADPYTAANIGTGERLGLSLGVYQLMINLVLLILIFFFGRRHIGIGTVINMVLTGFLLIFIRKSFELFAVSPEGWLQKGLF